MWCSGLTCAFSWLAGVTQRHIHGLCDGREAGCFPPAAPKAPFGPGQRSPGFSVSLGFGRVCVVTTLFCLNHTCGLSWNCCGVSEWPVSQSLEGLSGARTACSLPDIDPSLLPQPSGPFCRSGQ